MYVVLAKFIDNYNDIHIPVLPHNNIIIIV